MTESEYNAIPAVRWSRLRSMLVSALRYRYDAENPKEDAAHFRIGRAMHAYILEPDAFEERFVCYRESKSVGEGAKKRWQAFQQENADRTILDAAELDAAVGAAKAVLAHPAASKLLRDGVKEHTVLWTDPETGLACKARVDQCNGHLVDLKSAREIGHRLFATTCARLGYVSQLAFYFEGCRANGLDCDPEPILIAVESTPPHDVVPYRVPGAVLEIGRQQVRALLGQLASCLERDEWPGLAADIVDLEMPEWYLGESEPVELVMPDGERLAL